ncbi:hypothetical protein Tsubulata_045337 [Turnera subulata]|uniref:Pentacotripeptide-repeat region of PRORP domain-containing protein n=1 Tax=Turnera subulata TaxID=218843 RepID=A0A9Q0J1W3_9ROSI|nr:hypothetical protein Tsubulata_045337 [Turnera subulata]
MRESQECGIKRAIFWLVFAAYSKADLPGYAIRAFGRMAEFGLKPGVDDLDMLLYTLWGWGDVGAELGEARRMFDEMRERGCAVDVLAYNSLLEAMCEGGGVEEAYKVFREMGSSRMPGVIRAYSGFRVLDKMRRYDLVPSVFIYNWVINSWGR